MTTARRSLLGLALAVTAAAAAAGTAGGAPGGVEVGGTVPSEIAIALGPPGAFTTDAKHRGAFQGTIEALITSTVDTASLSIADADDPTGPAHGHLRDGAGLVPAPLEVGLAGHALQSLAAPADPNLRTWAAAIAHEQASIVVRQQLQRGSIDAPALHKVVLVTVSTKDP
jgi:hypothetical protein